MGFPVNVHIVRLDFVKILQLHHDIFDPLEGSELGLNFVSHVSFSFLSLKILGRNILVKIIRCLSRMEDGSTLAMGRDVEGCSGNEKVDDDDRVGEHGSDALEGEEIGLPTVGMACTSEEDVRDYYSKYAQHEGFGIYRRSSRCGDDGKVKYFTLACANAGKVRTTIANKKFPMRQSAKTNCMAKINGTVESDV